MTEQRKLDHTMKLKDLEATLEFLLSSAVTLNNEFEDGPAGNQKLIELFFSILKSGTRPRIFCDIGANDGSTAINAKLAFPQTRVISMEANPNIHKMFASRVSSFGVEFLNAAAAANDGEVTIYVPRRLSRAYIGGEIVDMVSEEPVNTGKSSLLRRDEDSTYDEVTVPSITLDSLLSEALNEDGERSVALWIDVEGAAYQVLTGALRTLDRTSTIFIETEGYRFWQDQKMSNQVALFLVQRGFVPVAKDREYGDKQFNTIFVHSSLVSQLVPVLFRKKGGPSGSTLLVPQESRHMQSEKSRIKSYTSIVASIASEIPVYIPSFNNPTYVASMVSQLRRWNIPKIVIVDNSSTYDGTQALLDSLEGECKVIRLKENHGPQSIILNPDNYRYLPDVFCITDPDLLFHPDMPQEFLLTLLKVSNQLRCGKVGLALDILDAEAMRSQKITVQGRQYHIWEWEAQFWNSPAGSTEDGNPIFCAHVDTTFALYNKAYFSPDRFYDAHRVAGKYTCKHLPWYVKSTVPAEEEAFYRATQKFSYYAR